MDGLRDFLLERISEEEALAQAAIDAHSPGHAWESVDQSGHPDAAHFAHWNPWRVLASSVAKRLIIAAHRDVGPGVDRKADPEHVLKAHACSTCGQYDEYAIEWPCYTLRTLALEWVDHPSYRPEWRPQRLSSGVGRVPAVAVEERPRRAPAPREPGEPTRSPGEPAARTANEPTHATASVAAPVATPGQPAA
jgi:hypothetical protein